MSNKANLPNSGWIKSPEVKQRLFQSERRASSVPNTPVQKNNFGILSPPGKKKKKKKRLQSVQQWDQTVPQNDGLLLSITDTQPDHKLSQQTTHQEDPVQTHISFLEYLKDELTVADFDSAQELKRERVTNFLGVPSAIEKLMGFGIVVCLDSFLYTFTILPLRFCLAFYHYILYLYNNIQSLLQSNDSQLNTITRFIKLRPSQKCDLLKGLLIMITCLVMGSLDPSRIYHTIRGQAVLKLYVVFNVLEICDKLCCSLGVDILDALFSKSTLANSKQDISKADYMKRQLKPITLFCLATVYMVVHTSVLFFQMITLNVAINFYSNALLSLLISNQFVEIKQNVFKRFEKENLFQLTCSGPSSVMPSTFVPLLKLPASTSLNTLMTPVVMVIASELMVDWLKHAFITKFNQIRPSIYGRYIDVLCKDLVIGNPGRMTGKHHAFVDQSPVVSRRIGFPVLPLACLYIRMMQQILPMMFMSHHGDSYNQSGLSSIVTQNLLNYLMNHKVFLKQILPARIQLVMLSMIECGWLEKGLDKVVWYLSWLLIIAILALILLALKVVVGVNLLGFAYRRFSTMEEREREETAGNQTMKELGKDEAEYTSKLRSYLSKPEDHTMGQPPGKFTLETVDRYSMVKSRIP
ncbi:eukaryotic membrane protein family-domain-containing protein [Pilobolus umbonatus]|nr:eukaryotic membrane protein family-domain-containing protein [Pilobolus umbonatus]